MTTVQERYEVELVKSDHDHHVPTAGAMAGHVLSNLMLMMLKLRQGAAYARSREIKTNFAALAAEELVRFDSLAARLLDENEVIPTTTEEFVKYGMLEEAASDKYEADEVRLETALHDFGTQNLFITRAIKLADKEEKFALSSDLTALYGFNLQQIRLLAGDLGKEIADFKEEDDDD